MQKFQKLKKNTPKINTNMHIESASYLRNDMIGAYLQEEHDSHTPTDAAINLNFSPQLIDQQKLRSGHNSHRGGRSYSI